MGTPPDDTRTTLRDLSLPIRLVIAAFLLSVGLGYIAAIAQLKMQLAKPGNIAPEPGDAIDAYHGKPGASQMERVLLADENKPFNGSGQMSSAFTTRGGLAAAANRLAKKKKIDRPTAEAELRKKRDGERLALVDWVRNGARNEAYEADNYPLTGALADHPLTDKYLVEDSGQRGAMIQSILRERCVRCHNPNYSGPSSMFPLETYEDVAEYCKPERGGGMSLPKLAQTTHVHLLGFSMLWGLTGLIFAFTSYPFWMRLVIGPWVLVAQVLDISCWWLSRMEGHGPYFAQAIMVTGGLVALGLALQVVLSLFNLFGKGGKAVVALLLLAGALGLGGLYVKVIDPYLQSEKPQATAKE